MLYPQSSWARSAVNSGLLSKFPILHKILLSSHWARHRLFRLYADKAVGAQDIVHYIPQAVCPAGSGEPLPLAGEEDPLGELRKWGPYLLVLGRSGTGKSVLLKRLHRLEAARFRDGKTASLPVLLDALNDLGEKDDQLADALKNALVRDGDVELSKEVLDFLIRKGGFLILVDGLNERSRAADALNHFLKRDTHNVVLMASQTDVLPHRPGVARFAMAEVSPEEAGRYFDAAIGPGVWDKLSPELRVLARNPQDLKLIAEDARKHGLENLPRRRTDLYDRKINDDSVLRKWVETADRRLDVIYALAFRMLAEQRVLGKPELAKWVRTALAEQELESEPQEVDVVTAAMSSSSLFREAGRGEQQNGLAFDHELIGAFLAARYVRVSLEEPPRESRLDPAKKEEWQNRRKSMLDLARQEEWQNVFFFVVDEVPSAALPRMLLDDLLKRGGDVPLRIVAYAIKSKEEEGRPLPEHILAAYTAAKLRQDLSATPAAA